jgi:hypothetical protein
MKYEGTALALFLFLFCVGGITKAARQTPAAGKGKVENDWLPGGEQAMCVFCPEPTHPHKVRSSKIIEIVLHAIVLDSYR